MAPCQPAPISGVLMIHFIVVIIALTGAPDVLWPTPVNQSQTVEWVPKGYKQDRIKLFKQFCGWRVLHCSKLTKTKPFDDAPKERGYFCTFKVDTPESLGFNPNLCP